jgi:hypothetical protein
VPRPTGWRTKPPLAVRAMRGALVCWIRRIGGRKMSRADPTDVTFARRRGELSASASLDSEREHTMKPTFKAIAVALGMACAAAIAPAQDKAVPDGLALAQGHWERTGKDRAGKTIRVTKDVEGNKETVTNTTEDGAVISAHQDDFKLEESGNVRIFK